MLQIRRNVIIIFLALCAMFSLYYFLKYNIFHPVKRLSIDEISSIQFNNEIYDVSKNKPFIQDFLIAYNRAKLNKNQELNTTPDFTVTVNLKNGESIRILDGDTTYSYIEYKNESVIAYSPDLIKFFENILANKGKSEAAN